MSTGSDFDVPFAAKGTVFRFCKAFLNFQIGKFRAPGHGQIV